MTKKEFMLEFAALPEEEAQHIMAVCADIAKRLPEHKFGKFHECADSTTIEYTPQDLTNSVKMVDLVVDGVVVGKTSVEFDPNGVVVGMAGVSAQSEKGGVG